MDSSERKQLRRYLAWGFGLSLLLHVVLGPFLGHVKYSEPEKTEPTIVSVSKKPTRIVTPKPTPTPTPPPKPTATPTPPPKATPTPPPTPKPTPPPPKPKQTQPPHKSPPAPAHLKVNVPKTTSAAQHQPAENAYTPTAGSENGVPAGHGAVGAASGTGNGDATTGTLGTPAAAACAQPHVDPSTKNPVQPEYPEVAREQGAYGTAKVAVTLDAHGAVVSAAISQSTGNVALDQEAVKAAKASTYSPEVVDCKPVGGVYIFRAVFDSQ